MKLAVIVGGSAGLGLILAEQLAVEGVARIVLVARNAERLSQVVAELGVKFPRVEFQACEIDIAQPGGAATLAQRVAAGSQPVDLLINAIGLSDRGTLLGLKSERLDELMRANVLGPLVATQSLVPLMQPGSTIVNIGSLSSYFAPSYLGGYSIAKHGLRALTQQLRMELTQQGIRVLLVCPGPIARADTGTRYAHLESAADVPKEALQGGGGAKIKGLDPQRLAVDIVHAIRSGRLEIIRPRKARLLLIVSAIWPKLGHWILQRNTAG